MSENENIAMPRATRTTPVAVERFRLSFVCNHGGYSCPYQREYDTENEQEHIRHTAYGKVGERACQRRECHYENARADSRFQLKAENACQKEKHHHAAARADKAADKADYRAADNGFYQLFLCGNALHGFLCGHNRLDNKLDAEQECHYHREIAHCRRGDKAGYITADNGENEHAHHHDKSVFQIEIFVFAVGVCRYRAREHIGGEGYADGGIRLHAEKGHEHRRYHGGGTHAGKARAESRAHARKKAYDYFYENFHLFSIPSYDFFAFSRFLRIFSCSVSNIAFSSAEKPRKSAS